MEQQISANQEMRPLVYTREQAAALAQVSLPTLDAWIHRFNLPVIRISRYYRIPAKLFEQWLEDQAGNDLYGRERK